MSFWKRNRDNGADAEFDDRMFRSRASFIEHYNATYNFEVGLADVYARAGMVRPDDSRNEPASLQESETDSGNPVLDQICEHIDMIDMLLASVTDGDVGPLVTATYLTTARQLLLRLRTGLRAKLLTHQDAFNLIRQIQHNLREIDLVMHRHHGLSLDDALQARIGELKEINTDVTEQMERLEANVNRLFDTEHESVELMPVH